MATGRIDIIGLGPMGIEWVLPADRDLWNGASVRLLRTRVHPAAEALLVAATADPNLSCSSFDSVYEQSDEIEDVYETIAARVLAFAAEHDRVVYAVPGDPSLAERSVVLIRSAAASAGIPCRVHPALGVEALARAAMGTVDCIADGHHPDSLTSAWGSVLVTQVDSPFVLSDVKLELLDRGLLPQHEVVMLRRLGAKDGSIESIALVDLDRTPTDHLTSLWLQLPEELSAPLAPRTEAARAIDQLLEVGTQLRNPGGCPWDAEQTHHSLRKYVLEEAHEVVEALDRLPPNAPHPQGPFDQEAYGAVQEELGDLLYQVVFHSLLAAEVNAFTFADVVDGIRDKLIRRHESVFGEGDPPSSVAEALAEWERVKSEEKLAVQLLAEEVRIRKDGPL